MQLNGRSSGIDADFETVAVDAGFEAAEVSVDLLAVEVALAFEASEVDVAFKAAAVNADLSVVDVALAFELRGVFSAVFMPHLLLVGRWLKLLSHDATERLQRPLPTLCGQRCPESRER